MRHRLVWIGIAALLVLVAGAIAGASFYFGTVTLRVAVGPAGADGQKFMAAFIPLVAAERPRARFQSVTTDDPTATAKALEDGNVDLAIVRSDIAAPKNGRTIAILRRDAVLVIAPAKSEIESVEDLKGKVVGIVPAGPATMAALDQVLDYYGLPATAVQRIGLVPSEIGNALRQKKIVAVFALGPVGSGRIVECIAAVAKAGRGDVELVGLEEAEAMVKRLPGFETIEVPVGAFRAHPALPDESKNVLSVTYRLVARSSMLNWTAGEITRLLFLNKAKLAHVMPSLNQIEAQDSEDNSSSLPVHPGAAAYLTGSEESALDTFENLFWKGSMALSLVGGLFAAIRGLLRRRPQDFDRVHPEELVAIMKKIRSADSGELLAMEGRLDEAVETLLAARKTGAVDDNEFQSSSLALAQARRAIDTRRSLLSTAQQTEKASVS